MRRNDVDETEDGNKRHTDEPHDHLLPESQRLQETHLRAVPDARQVLLTVGMSYKLYSRSSSTQQRQIVHIIPLQRRRDTISARP